MRKGIGVEAASTRWLATSSQCSHGGFHMQSCPAFKDGSIVIPTHFTEKEMASCPGGVISSFVGKRLNWDPRESRR